MAVALVDNGGRWTFTNADGDWHLWKAHTIMSSGARVGPGYIGRMRRPNSGMLLVEDASIVPQNATEERVLNDPRFGGLGAFGCHVARKNEAWTAGDPVEEWAWDLTERMSYPVDGLGVSDVRWSGVLVAAGVGQATVEVDLRDGYSDPVFTVRRVYTFHDSRVDVDVTVTATWDGSGPPLYVKEPKFVAHSIGPVGGPAYRYVNVYGPTGTLLRRVDYYGLPSPTVDTEQIGDDGRCRLRFEADPGNWFLNVVAEALDANGTRHTWEGASVGLDAWAVDANGRTPLEATGAAYCRQGPGGTLTRKWEATRWASDGRDSPPMAGRPHVGVMLHAWEGGSGYPDCRTCFVPVEPGESWRTFLGFSYDSGWVV